MPNAYQKGSLFLLKLGGTGTSGTTIASLRTTGLKVDGQTVDVTNKDSAGFRELLAGGGITSMSLTGAGVLSDNDDHSTLMGYVSARTLNTFGIEHSDEKTVGSFQVTSVEEAGDYNGEQTYSITLESSGAWTTTTT